MVTRFLIVLEIAALIFAATTRRASAADPPGRTDQPRDAVKLRAQAALALAKADADAKARGGIAGGQPASPAVAPAPREARLTYAAGYKRATLDQMPLVILVNCEMPAPADAVVSRTTCFGDTCGPAVIVGFPVGGRLYVDSKLTGKDVTQERVDAAVESAAKKIEVPAKEMPGAGVKGKEALPVPLDYQIKADSPDRPAKSVADVKPVGCGSCGVAGAAPCACGVACKCPAGVCPDGCPDVLTPTIPPPPDGYHAEVGLDGKTWWVRDGMTFSHNAKAATTGAKREEVKPIAASPLYRSTQITPATGVAGHSTSWSGSYPVAGTYTLAPGAVVRGSIGDGCPPAG